MDNDIGTEIAAELGRAEAALGRFIGSLMDPWVLAQFVIVAIGIGVGVWLGARIERTMEPRVREVHGRPRLLRLLALLLRRARWIAAGLILLGAAVAIRAATEPGNSAIVTVAAALIGSWVAISIVSRLIRNRVLARLVAWLGWIYVALRITGATDDVTRALDALAIRIGALRISAYDVIEAAIVVAAVLWLALAAANLLERRIALSRDLTPSFQVLIGKLVKVVLLVAAGAFALAALGIDLTALTVFSGALGVGIGFGLQKVVSNFVSGIIILLDKSIKPGDTISLGDTYGWIKDLRARFVSVVTRDGRSYLIPNEDFIIERVVNWSFRDTLVRIDVEFGVAYDFDPHEVRKLAAQAAAAVDRVRPEPKPVCHLAKFNDFSIDFILRFWISDPQNGVTNVRGAVMLACWDAFKAAGITFPYPRHEIVVKRPVEIRHAPAQPEPAGPDPVD